MKTISNLLFFFFSLFIFFSCSPRTLVKSYDELKINRAYAESVGDAAKPQEWEISRNLSAIDESNNELVWKEINGEKYLLVASWKADTKYYKNDEKTGFYNTGNYPIWVTAAPELQNKCQDKKFGRKEGLDLRLKQLFGLPPNVEKKYFVEFWVRPKDLFRPCPDEEITDENCDLIFPENTSEEHQAWVNDLRLASYYNAEWDHNYPWTQLGYTYDWNKKNKNHVGLSEFVIGKDADVIIKGFVPTEEYCASSD